MGRHRIERQPVGVGHCIAVNSSGTLTGTALTWNGDGTLAVDLGGSGVSGPEASGQSLLSSGSRGFITYYVISSLEGDVGAHGRNSAAMVHGLRTSLP